MLPSATAPSGPPHARRPLTAATILAGLETPDAGTVHRAGSVGHLPQLADLAAAGDATVRAIVLERIGVAAAAQEVDPLTAALARVAAPLGQARDALAADAPLRAQVRELTGVDEAAARTAPAAFGLGADAAERPAGSLSPGERTRAEWRPRRDGAGRR